MTQRHFIRYFYAAPLMALGLAAIAGDASAEVSEGVWRGYFSPSSGSDCGRLQAGEEAPLRIRVQDGRAAFIFGPRNDQTEATGRIDGKGYVRADGTLPGRGHPAEFSGTFGAGQFTGAFEFRLPRGTCAGTVKAVLRGGDNRSASSAQIEKERAARAAAEKEAEEMKQRLARLEAAQQTVTRSLQAQPKSTGASVEEQLAALKRLKDGGLISDAQYKTRQRAILDRSFGGGTTASAVDPAATTAAKTEFHIPANIKFGDYHALVIGINNYENLTKLDNAEHDARAIADVLKNKYDFKVSLMIDPSREDIIDKLDDLRATLKFKDNLLIYYAGHGWLDEGADQGFWLPANAKPDRRSAWVSNGIITGTLKAMEAKHVMVIADSCYSGRLVRGAKVQLASPDYYKKMSRKKARVAITSGGLEPVADSAGGKHSPFAAAFLKALNENDGVLDGTRLFEQIRRPVMVNANQTPQYSDVRKAGHDGGDFLLVRRK